MTGQDAVNVAKSFDETLGIDGIVLTKLDGRYPRRVRRFRSGQSPASRSSSSAPAKSSTTWSPSIPTAWPPRILGMGDVLTLIEKAQSAVDEQKALEMAQKLKEQSFDMNDLLEQMQQIHQMGSLSQVISMFPGAGKVSDEDAAAGEAQMRRTEAIIQSMTKREREKPSIINPSRKRRIAAGSGTRVEDVNRLLKQFEQMQKMMKMMGSQKFKKMARRGRFF